MDIDLQSINDPNVLKVMAYDALVAKEQAERELYAINDRLRQVLMHVSPTMAAAAANGGSADETTPPAANDGIVTQDTGQ